MKIRRTYRYLCDHCNKGFWKKEDCLSHERKCFKNPSVKSCWNCGLFGKEDGEPFYCDYYGLDLCINPTEVYEMKYKNGSCNYFSRG